MLTNWNDGPTKATIVDFVERVTTEGGPDFVAPEARVAVFDNDGTLWCEKPIRRCVTGSRTRPPAPVTSGG